MNQNYVIGGLVAVIVVLGLLVYMQGSTQQGTIATTTPGTTPTPSPTPGTTPPTPPSAETMQVKIALLDTTGEGTGKSRGCDTVTMVNRTVPKSSGVLAASLQALFAEPEGTQPSTAYNFIARTKNTLKFDKVTIVNGTANIYLTGSLSGLAGVCDDPRAGAQIEETALQFATVKKVQLYLNGAPTTLMPSQQ